MLVPNIKWIQIVFVNRVVWMEISPNILALNLNFIKFAFSLFFFNEGCSRDNRIGGSRKVHMVSSEVKEISIFSGVDMKGDICKEIIIEFKAQWIYQHELMHTI